MSRDRNYEISLTIVQNNLVAADNYTVALNRLKSLHHAFQVI